MALLPSNPDRETYALVRSNPAAWISEIEEIARAHRLGGVIVPFAKGSNLVAAIGAQWVVKLFPPFLRHQFVSERAALIRLAGALSVSIPAVAHEGEREAWPYLVLSRLSGTLGEDAWPQLSASAKSAILGRVGGLIAEVHSLAPGSLLALEPQWPAFVEAQIAGCHARHERLGLPPRLLEGLEAFVAESRSLIPREPVVILTGEYVPENLLLDGERITGLIDFGDVMTGWREYDLLGPSLFMAPGNTSLLRALFSGYGIVFDEPLRRRLMLLWLLHRHADLPHQLRLEGWATARSLAELESRIWPLRAT